MRVRGPLLLLLTLLAAPLPSFGQRITGSIEGRVTDPTGAVLPGVEVSVTNEQTQLTRTTVTNEVGLYNIPLLPSGSYQ